MPKGFEHHDHAACIDAAMQAVESHCSGKGLQFTPVRRRALEILLQEHRAMGAYEVLEKLRDTGFGSQPPVAYRALDFLVGHGFAHRIERLNAFVACGHPGELHAPCFLICRDCSVVVETPGRKPAEAVRASAEELGFAVERMTIEALGLCPGCSEAPGAEA